MGALRMEEQSRLSGIGITISGDPKAQFADIMERQRRVERKLDAIIEMMLTGLLIPNNGKWVFEDIISQALGDDEKNRLVEQTNKAIDEHFGF